MLAEALKQWTKTGGDLRDILSSDRDQPVKSKAEAAALCAALDALRARRHGAGKHISSSLRTLTAFFQQVESKEAVEVMKQEGLPRLRVWVRDLLDDRDVDEDDVMFIMKMLAMYRQPEDVALIAEAARKPIHPDAYMWSIVFGRFDGEHPYSADMVHALSKPLPAGFIRVAYLDMANRLAIAGKLDRHPFDTPEGRGHLDGWLSDSNREHFSYAHSATAALPFIEQPSRGELLRTASDHPATSVRMEAAWAQAKLGDPAGLERLTMFCLDPRCSRTAGLLLEQLGHAARIPEEVRRPDFQAVTEMADWLAHPNEFGRTPDHIELLDTRELFWPPTNDRRQVALIGYTYNGDDGSEPDRGVGMVGSVTFALFGESTVDLSPEDVYGLHCCWELEMNEDNRAPKKRTAQSGREILSRHNNGF